MGSVLLICSTTKMMLGLTGCAGLLGRCWLSLVASSTALHMAPSTSLSWPQVMGGRHCCGGGTARPKALSLLIRQGSRSLGPWHTPHLQSHGVVGGCRVHPECWFGGTDARDWKPARHVNL